MSAEYRAACQRVKSAYADRDADTFVYAIQAGQDGPIKIGIAKKPRERLLTLQTAHHERLRGLAVWSGGREEERLLHDTFATDRLEGEWFSPTEELLALVDFLGGPPNSCDWQRESDCLMSDDAPGTCKACGFQVLDEAA